MLERLVKEALATKIEGILLFDEPLSKHTSFRIGGPADVLVVPLDLEDLKKTLKVAEKNNIPLIVIGNGTKLLVSDDGIEGITVKLSGCFNDLAVSGRDVRVGAGYPLAGLSRSVADWGLSGLEFAVGIPGTVGGGIAMNAGAHGHSIGDAVTKVAVIGCDGEIKEYEHDELGFSFRCSRFQVDNSIILKCEMLLEEGVVGDIQKKMSENLSWRKENQPLDFPNAGSIFKNPEGLVAGRLIDDCGLKGMRVGDAQVSEKRANFIVNLGKAKASDVQELMTIAQSRVFEKFGIRLEPEIRLVGRF